ncbi:hypothetical protein GE061_016676 [Apolygus lucorum]|uniref:Reverse transcriptase zinc-binding domain-containing protein n=1 Tax=Apolygus lucorum TaxID=248454 RepID=A0A8S9XI48_APOLU|nr:hypothetical protein GE061_016676 [Apolygus lucorum]
MAMPANRYPRLVAAEVVNRRVFWFSELQTLARRHGATFDGSLADLGAWRRQLGDLVDAVKTSWREDMLQRAQESNKLYGKLNKEIVPAAFAGKLEEHPLWVVRWLVRFRGSLLSLNSKPYNQRDDPSTLCSLCNMGVREDMAHFLGVCPVLAEYRVRYLGAAVLEEAAMIRLLDGGDWPALARFGSRASKYRAELIAEFNW